MKHGGGNIMLCKKKAAQIDGAKSRTPWKI